MYLRYSEENYSRASVSLTERVGMSACHIIASLKRHLPVFIVKQDPTVRPRMLTVPTFYKNENGFVFVITIHTALATARFFVTK